MFIKNYIKASISLLGGLFLSLSFLSYCPTDHSILFSSSQHLPIHNYGGWLGAQTVGFLLYLFGSSAFFLIPFFCLLAVLYTGFFSVRHELDRLIALLLLIPVFGVVSASFNVELMTGCYPGGLLGSSCWNSTMPLLGAATTRALLFVIVWGLLLIIARTSLMVAARFVLALCARIPVRATYSYCSQYVAYLGQRVRGMAMCAFGVKKEKEISQKDLFQEQIWSLYTAQVREQSQEHDRLTSHVDVPIIDDTQKLSEILPEVHEPPVYMLPEVPVAPESGSHHERAGASQKEHERVAQVLEHKLERFGIQGKVVSITHGPSITLFEYQPAVDTKISTIIAREDDLALALQALSLRIIAPIPGKSVVGFEVARAQRTKIVWSDVMRSSAAQNFVGELPLILGVDTVGNELLCDLAAAPHILVAGSTGSGKSVCLHTMIMSLLCKKTPDELKIILIDPKRLEFSWYADVAHLLFPVITTTDKAILALRWAVKTMEERYELLAQKGVRTVKELGLPTIVIVIDELADLMMTAGKEVEYLIARLAQMARAAGIHMITATQRPSVDVITGLIKVNFPCRIAFRVMSKIDSRTIIDSSGAEKLLGKGDMLILDAKGSLMRAQGAFVSDSMVKEVVHAIKSQRIPEYEQLTVVDAVQTTEEDTLFEAIVSFVLQKDEVSISLLQRAFRIGYNRAARLIDSLEAQGHIMPAQGAKMRKVVK